MKNFLFPIVVALSVCAFCGITSAQTLTNPSFEDGGGGGLTGWTNNTSWSIDGMFPNPGGAQDGSHWASYSYGGGLTSTQELYQDVTVTPGNAHQLDIYVCIDGNHSSAVVDVWIVWVDGGGYDGLGGGAEADTIHWTHGGGGLPWTLMSGTVYPTVGTMSFIIRTTISGWGGGVNADACAITDLGSLDTPTPVPTSTPVPPTPTEVPLGPLTLIDDLDTPGDPPADWTKFDGGWGSAATIDGGTTHISLVCTSLDILGPDGSSGMVRGFLIEPNEGGHVAVDMAVPAGGVSHWIETAYCIYETDPGAAQAGADFDAMAAYGTGATGHASDPEPQPGKTNWRAIVKFDGWTLGTDNGDTWQTYSTLTGGSCVGGSCPGGGITTRAGETIMYIGFKVGNGGGGSVGPVYYDYLRMSEELIYVEEPTPVPPAGVEEDAWRLYR